MAIPNPYPNIADDVKSDVTTYSSNKIESLIKTATELPIPEAGDAGKVLTVNEDADGYKLDDIPAELPTPEVGDAGKVLTVNAGEDGYELKTPVAPTSIIDDTASSATTVYSSDKVDTLLSGKEDTLAHGVIETGSLNDAAVGYAWVKCLDVTEAPVNSGYGYLETLSAAANNFMQRFTVYGSSPEMYVRFYANSQWYSWYKIATVIT